MTIEIKVKEILHLFEANLNHKYAHEISKVLIMHLGKDEIAMAQIFKSFLGIVPKTDFKIGDDVFVNMSDLPTWRMEVKAMQDKNMVHKSHLPCVIKSIDLTKRDAIEVTYKMLDKNEVEVMDTYWVREEAVSAHDIIFYEPKPEPDLPF